MAEIKLAFDQTLKLTPLDTTQGRCLRPMLPVRLSYNENSIDLDAMVDTGADFSHFPNYIAQSLGIPEDELIPDTVITLKKGDSAWFCPIGISFLGKTFNCRACFIDNRDFPAVIGRDTIFSRLKFAFRQSIGQFYISLSP